MEAIYICDTLVLCIINNGIIQYQCFFGLIDYQLLKNSISMMHCLYDFTIIEQSNVNNRILDLYVTWSYAFSIMAKSCINNVRIQYLRYRAPVHYQSWKNHWSYAFSINDDFIVDSIKIM